MTSIAERSQDMKLSRVTVRTLEDLVYQVDYNAADEYTQDDLAYCNFPSQSFCPEHKNRLPLGRRLRAAPARRRLSAEGTEIAIAEGAKQLQIERAKADDRVESDDDLVFIGGDVITMFIEEGGHVFGKTVTCGTKSKIARISSTSRA